MATWLCRALALLVALVFAGGARAQTINATAEATGLATALTFTARTEIPPEWVVPGAKLWLVLVQANGAWFHSATEGFVPYTGQAGPEHREITQAVEVIQFREWDTTGNLGAAIYVGYGSSFWEMIEAGRFRHVHTLVDRTQQFPYNASGVRRCYNVLGTYIESLNFQATETGLGVWSPSGQLIYSMQVMSDPPTAADPDYRYKAPASGGRLFIVTLMKNPLVISGRSYRVMYLYTYAYSTQLNELGTRLCE